MSIAIADSSQNTSEMSFEYVNGNLNELNVSTHTDDKGRKNIGKIFFRDHVLEASPRFMQSLYARYQINRQFFQYFDPNEVFERILHKHGKDDLRFTIEKGPYKTTTGTPTTGRLLASSNPNTPVIQHSELHELLMDSDAESVQYADGVIRARYSPRGEQQFEIVGDAFDPKYDLMVPIDGYGSPQTVLGFLRLVCSNGAVLFSKIFTDKIPSAKKNELGALARIAQVVQSYGSDEGYAAVRARLDMSTKSLASVAECLSLRKQLFRALVDIDLRKKVKSEEEAKELEEQNLRISEILKTYTNLTGDFTTMYGLINENSIGLKRMQTIPSRATVYDLINFGTEIATHRVQSEIKSRAIHGFVGSMLGGEFDLENSAPNGRADFIDIFAKSASGASVATTPKHNLDELVAEAEDDDLAFDPENN